MDAQRVDGEFRKGAEERSMVQLKGPRGVGGMRAFIYNTMPIEEVEAVGKAYEGV